MNTNPLGSQPANTQVSGWVLIQAFSICTSVKNDPYIKWEGLDVNSIKVNGTYFSSDKTVPLPKVEQNKVYHVSGPVGVNKQGLLSIWASEFFKVEDLEAVKEFESHCYPSVPQEELTKYIEELREFSNSFSDSNLNTLSGYLFNYFEYYLPYTPAGKRVHEPIRGGLAKHTWEVVKACDAVRSVKKGLQKDVLLFSALYHDVGKTQEYTDKLMYSPNGRLISHTSIAIQLITKFIVQNNITLDPELFRQIKHCFLSHHGEYSEIRPATKEAIILYFCDDMLSKVGHIEEVVRSGGIGEDGFGRYSNILNQSPYVPELKTV